MFSSYQSMSLFFFLFLISKFFFFFFFIYPYINFLLKRFWRPQDPWCHSKNAPSAETISLTCLQPLTHAYKHDFHFLHRHLTRSIIFLGYNLSTSNEFIYCRWTYTYTPNILPSTRAPLTHNDSLRFVAAAAAAARFEFVPPSVSRCERACSY